MSPWSWQDRPYICCEDDCWEPATTPRNRCAECDATFMAYLQEVHKRRRKQ